MISAMLTVQSNRVKSNLPPPPHPPPPGLGGLRLHSGEEGQVARSHVKEKGRENVRGSGGGSSSRSEKGRRRKKACSQRMFPNPAGLLPRHHLLPAPLLPLRPHSHRRQRGKTAEDHQRGTGEQISRTRGGSRKAAPLPHRVLLETLLMLHPQVGEAHSPILAALK